MIEIEETNEYKEDSYGYSSALFLGAIGIVLSVLFTDRNVYPMDIETAIKRCESSNSELEYFEIGLFQVETYCKNGAVFTDSAILNPDSKR